MSSEWEEFCESMGLNAGSEEDYDIFLDRLEGDSRTKQRSGALRRRRQNGSAAPRRARRLGMTCWRRLRSGTKLCESSLTSRTPQRLRSSCLELKLTRFRGHLILMEEGVRHADPEAPVSNSTHQLDLLRIGRALRDHALHAAFSGLGEYVGGRLEAERHHIGAKLGDFGLTLNVSGNSGETETG